MDNYRGYLCLFSFQKNKREYPANSLTNNKIVKRIENENAKKELDKKKKEGIISQALAKARKTKALKKGKAKKNVKKIKSNPKL